MKVTNVALSVRVTVDTASLEDHAAASADVVGSELARTVAEYSRRHKLGYYPALDYFQDLDDAIDRDLLDAADSLSWLTTRLVREEVRKRLRPLFASMRIDAMQNLAYTMPQVRPGRQNDMALLAEHFTPNVVKLDLTASIMTRHDTGQDMTGHAAHQVYRWLKDHFFRVEVTSCRQLD